MKFEAPRGTRDILPAEQPLWRRIVAEAERLCDQYGYRRIDTPVFEDTELFARTSGPGSDVVQKEMYTFRDRGDRSLTLRPEGTAGICRAYLEHGLHREPQPQKLYTIGTMYRYATPQKGRYREHWQLSVEAIGSDNGLIDAELIHLYDTLLRNLGVRAYRLELNSIGDRACRPAYVHSLTDWLRANEASLDDETRAKGAVSPLRVFDNYESKPPEVQRALADAPKIGESLCEDCRTRFQLVRDALDLFGVQYDVVPTLVRGLDYYTRTTWEFVGPEGGSQSSISGGGRYDYLVEEIGGPATPAVGFGAGIERLMIALEGAGVSVEQPPIDVFIVVEHDARLEWVVRLLRDLRAQGMSVETDFARRSPRGQFTQARRLRARATVVVWPTEATIRRPGVRDEHVALENVVARLAP